MGICHSLLFRHHHWDGSGRQDIWKIFLAAVWWGRCTRHKTHAYMSPCRIDKVCHHSDSQNTTTMRNMNSGLNILIKQEMKGSSLCPISSLFHPTQFGHLSPQPQNDWLLCPPQCQWCSQILVPKGRPHACRHPHHPAAIQEIEQLECKALVHLLPSLVQPWFLQQSSWFWNG